MKTLTALAMTLVLVLGWIHYVLSNEARPSVIVADEWMRSELQGPLHGTKSSWKLDKANGKWIHCIYLEGSTEHELKAAKCWKVPGRVTMSRDAFFKN